MRFKFHHPNVTFLFCLFSKQRDNAPAHRIFLHKAVSGADYEDHLTHSYELRITHIGFDEELLVDGNLQGEKSEHTEYDQACVSFLATASAVVVV